MIFEAANQLFFKAGPSIQYRVRKELFHQAPTQPEMTNLQDRILQDRTVTKILNGQDANGWLAQHFHGYDSMEARLRLLCEKGVETIQPVLSRALLALEEDKDRLQSGLGRVGPILDDLGFGGGRTIRASLFALAGREEKSFVEEQIQAALEAFQVTARIRSLDEIYEPSPMGFVFRKGICWPSIYHLRLLAWTKNWRIDNNCRMVTSGIQNLLRFSPLPNIYVKYKSQIIAPASFCMHHFTPDMDNLSDSDWMQWFHRMEVLSRLGGVEKVPELRRQVRALEKILATNHGMFVKALHHPYFYKWGAYTGLALEKDWRSEQRRINDLTFRSLLILNYSGGFS